jgi:tRNA pseudouridine55 synthase
MAELSGLLVLDKPSGITSRAAVDAAARWFPRRTRIGHTGTLDPLATGVLVLCVGTATRLTEYVQRMGKTYRADLLLGARSDTDDADGAITPVSGAIAPDPARVDAAVATFLGRIDQVPPAYSAAKVTGRRAYDLARAGEEVALTARSVDIYGIDVLRYDYPRLDLEVRCGKGTYIRSLARDLGEQLGCGACVAALRRTRVGPFTVDGALTPSSAAAAARGQLLPLAHAVADLPRLVLSPLELERLCHGQALPLTDAIRDDAVAVFDANNRLAAVATVDAARRLLVPVKVIVESRS